MKPANIVEEFKGYEIEQKFDVLRPVRSSYLRDIVNTILLKNKGFTTTNNKGEFKWEFYFDYYDYYQDDKLYQDFILINHPSTAKFWVRKKFKSTTYIFKIAGQNLFVSKRKEETQPFQHQLNNKLLKRIFLKEKAIVNTNRFIKTRLIRKKYYFFIKNSRAKRVYSISLDFCTYKENVLSQIEIEYKWRESRKKTNFENMTEILLDFKKISNILLKIDGLKPSIITKHEWLTKLR